MKGCLVCRPPHAHGDEIEVGGAELGDRDPAQAVYGVAVGPGRRVFGEEAQERRQEGSGGSVVPQAVENELSIFAFGDEAAVREDGEVLGDGGRREAEDGDHLADAKLAAGEHAEEAQTSRVCQSLRGIDEVFQAGGVFDSSFRHTTKCRPDGCAGNHLKGLLWER